MLNDELTAGVTAAKKYMAEKVMPEVPRIFRREVESVVTDVRITEMVADILDAVRLVQTKADPLNTDFSQKGKGNVDV